MKPEASFIVGSGVEHHDKSSLYSARVLGHGLKGLAMVLLPRPHTESVTLRHVLDVFEEAKTTGIPLTEADATNFIEAVRSAHQMHVTLETEKGFLILTFRCHLEKDASPFFEWKIRFESHGRISGSCLTEHMLTPA